MLATHVIYYYIHYFIFIIILFFYFFDKVANSDNNWGTSFVDFYIDNILNVFNIL